MPAPVSLQAVADALDIQERDDIAYLNPETGEIAVIGAVEQETLEWGDDPESLADWQREILPRLQEITESDRWLTLPDSFDIDEWSLMERFSGEIANPAVSRDLLESIRGRGAFRAFRLGIRRHGLEQRWEAFRREALREIAKEWLEENDIPYR